MYSFVACNCLNGWKDGKTFLPSLSIFLFSLHRHGKSCKLVTRICLSNVRGGKMKEVGVNQSMCCLTVGKIFVYRREKEVMILLLLYSFVLNASMSFNHLPTVFLTIPILFHSLCASSSSVVISRWTGEREGERKYYVDSKRRGGGWEGDIDGEM